MKKKCPNPEIFDKYSHSKKYQKCMSEPELLDGRELLWQDEDHLLRMLVDLPGFSNKIKVQVVMDFLDILNGMPVYGLKKCLGDSSPVDKHKTNTTNAICYFCGEPTQPMFGFGAMYCPKCQK